MESVDDIPSDWETQDAKVVTVNPHTGEVQEHLSPSGAGPQVAQLRGIITSKPCENCDSTMEYSPSENTLTCGCGATEDPRLHRNQNAK